MIRLFCIALLMLLTPAGLQLTSALTPTAPQLPEPVPSAQGAEGYCQVIEIAVETGPGMPATPGGPLVINATFGTGVTPARRNTIQAAINEWQALIQDAGSTPNPFPITFQFTDFGPSSTLLASTSVTFTSQGDLVRADMSFNTRYTFFEDPTQPPTSNYDLLSVARHELGHALGWVGTQRVTDLMSGSAFNPPRLNIPTTTVGCGGGPCHTDPAWLANDLMVPAIGTAERRPISLYPVASLVARAYGYRIPMQFVDPTYTGEETGTAGQPWRTMVNACSSPTARDIPLLLANATHLVPPSFACTSPHPSISAARGGAIISP